ncbi:MAG: HD family phosphohydrolase [Candidatus Eiseniibacteriota bacterium]
MTLWQQLERVAASAPAGTRADAALFHGVRVLLALVLAVLTYALFPSAPAVEVPLYEIGSVSSENVIAPFGFTVPKPPEQLARERAELARGAEPVFDYRPAALDSVQRSLATLMQGLARAAPSGRPDSQTVVALQQAAEASRIQLRPEEAAYLAVPRRREALAASLSQVFGRWLAQGVAASGALDSVRGDLTLRRGDREISIPADSVLTATGLLARSRQVHPDRESELGDAVYVKLLSALFRPTIVENLGATEQAREAMRRTVDENLYEVQAREKIVGANEVVGREEHEKLRALQDARQSRGSGGVLIGRVVGAVLFNFLVIAIVGITLVLYRPQLYATLRVVAFVAVVYLIILGIASFVAHGPVKRPELVPVALAAIVFSVLFDPRISMVATVVLTVLVGGQSAFRGTNALFLALIGGSAAAFSLRVLRRRNQSTYSILLTAGAYLLAAIAVGLTLDWSLREIAITAGLGAVNAFFSVWVAMGLLPLAEEFTGIDTDLKLLEWSDLNRPLMRKLRIEAPGTYAHTMAMANLAETACAAIGANALLARVGAYYHDIGKIKKPQYFVENQPKGRNPHDKLKPSTSAAIIRGHVREGLDLADEHRLPRALRAFITEHHGTAEISYFLEKAKERDGAVGNAQEFQYPGPVPQTAETAVCMLADGVEAATRVIADPTPQKIRDVVEHIVRQRVEQGQLRNAPITLRQLDIVKEQFARVLIGMYHNRIDYPASSGGVTAEFSSV